MTGFTNRYDKIFLNIVTIWTCSSLALYSLLGCSKSVPGLDERQHSVQSVSESTDSDREKNELVKSQAKVKSAEAFVQEASQLLDKQNIAGGWQVVQSGLIQYPSDPPLLFLAGRVLAFQQKYSEAIAILDKIPPNDPEAGLPALGQGAEWAVQLGDLRKAEDRLLSILKIAPVSPATSNVRRLLSKIYNSQGRRWEAGQQVLELIRIGDFTERELMMLVNLREPFDDPDVSKAAKAFNSKEPLTQLGEARVLIFHAQYQEAIDLLTEIRAKEPNAVEPWIWMGVAFVESEQFQELRTWNKNPPASFRQHPEYWNIMGEWMKHEDRLELAARCYCESIRRDRRNIMAHQEMGECLARIGLIEPAEQIRLRAELLIEAAAIVATIANANSDASIKSSTMEQVAGIYEHLEDPFLSLGWHAVAAFSRKQQPSPQLLASLKSLGKIKEPSIAVLDSLPVESWPLPESILDIPPDKALVVAKPDASKIRLLEVAKDLGVEFQFMHGGNVDQGLKIYEGIGGGVALLDYDRDGWVDLFFSQAGSAPKSPSPCLSKQLLHSIDGHRFSPATNQAQIADLGYGQGVSVSDYDQDGFGDIAVANFGSVRLYRNQGDGSFELTESFASLTNEEWNSALTLGDINGDGLPDILQCGYCLGPDCFTRTCPGKNVIAVTCHPHNFPPCPNHIWLNLGDGTWKSPGPPSQAAPNAGYTLGVWVGNLDQRFGNDVFYANDNSPNFLMVSERNEPAGWKWQESGAKAGVAVSGAGRTQACMGIAVGDVDRNNQFDLIVTNFRNDVNTVYLQSMPGVFYDGTSRTKMHRDSWDWLGFGCQLADLDDDGWLDFVVVNGHIDDYRKIGEPFYMPAQVFQNNHGAFRWLKSEESPGPYFDGEHLGRGLVQGDIDRDGRIDLVATHLEEPIAVLLNATQSSNHFLDLELVGANCDRDAIGATVKIRCGLETWTLGLSNGDGFYGSNERLIHAGIGEFQRIDEVIIQWPDGKSQKIENVDADQRLLVIQDQPPFRRSKKK